MTNLMNASVAVAAGLPFSSNYPDDFAGLDEILRVTEVPRPRT